MPKSPLYIYIFQYYSDIVLIFYVEKDSLLYTDLSELLSIADHLHEQDAHMGNFLLENLLMNPTLTYSLLSTTYYLKGSA